MKVAIETKFRKGPTFGELMAGELFSCARSGGLYMKIGDNPNRNNVVVIHKASELVTPAGGFTNWEISGEVNRVVNIVATVEK